MARIGANDVHPALTLDKLAILTNSLDARTYFHGIPRLGAGSHHNQELSIVASDAD